VTEKAVLNIVSRMKYRFAKMGVPDPTPPITGQSASGGASKPAGATWEASKTWRNQDNKARTRQSLHQCAGRIRELVRTATSFLTRRGKFQNTLAIVVTAVAVTSVIFLISNRKAAPKISGQPVVYWIERMGDLDPETAHKAASKVGLATKEDLQPYRTKLREMADAGSGDAVWMLWAFFGETNVKWIKFYLLELGSSGEAVLDQLDSKETRFHIVSALVKMQETGLAEEYQSPVFRERIKDNKIFAQLYLERLSKKHE
jgi:hypothetical protein